MISPALLKKQESGLFSLQRTLSPSELQNRPQENCGLRKTERGRDEKSGIHFQDGRRRQPVRAQDRLAGGAGGAGGGGEGVDGGGSHRPRRVPLDIRLLLRIFVVNSSCHIVPYISLSAPTLYIFLFLLFNVHARVSLAGSGGRVKGSRMVGRSARTQPEFKSKRLRRRPPNHRAGAKFWGGLRIPPQSLQRPPSPTPPFSPPPICERHPSFSSPFCPSLWAEGRGGGGEGQKRL